MRTENSAGAEERMKFKLSKNNGQYLYRIVLVVTAAAALLPVACNYIMDGGIVSEWIVRTQELSAGLRLFPSTEAFSGMWSRENGMDSNLWLIPAGILYRISGRMVLTYRIYMLVVQIMTLIFAKMFFESFFADKETKLSAFIGVLLYMTSPYRIYICYDLADISSAVVWMLLPLYAWAVLGILRGRRKIRDIVVGSLVLAGIGYAEIIYFFVLSAVTIFAVLYFRKVFPVITIGAGGILLGPVLYRLGQYLFQGVYEEIGIPIRSIMQNGYRFGQFFSSYAFRDGHPGMGLGMFACLLAGLWVSFVAGGGKLLKREKFFMIVSCIFFLLSLRYCPWDLAQRLGIWSLKLVSLINTPAIFAGLSLGGLCIPAAAGVERLTRQENRLSAFLVPFGVFLACLGICVCQCNMLTYSRLPMGVI